MSHSSPPEPREPCELCGSGDHAIYRKTGRGGQALQTVICRGCGLVFSNPQPCAAEDADYYKSRYWKDYKGIDTPNEAFFRRRIPKVREMAGRCLALLGDVESPRVLEIGCAAGALSMLLASEIGKRGRVRSIEPSRGHSEWASEHAGLDVSRGLLEEVAPTLDAGSFDLVVMNHVLEHVRSVRETCEIVGTLLKPDGLFVIEVPNVEHPGSRIGHFFHEAHNFSFSPNTLSRLAIVSGFSVKQMESLDGDLPGTRLFAVLLNAGSAPGENLPADDADDRAHDLDAYGRWYALTFASLRKKVTHAQRKRKYARGLASVS